MGDRSFGYSAQTRPFLWVFLVLTPGEILLLDLIVPPWPWLRTTLLVLGVLSGLGLAYQLRLLYRLKHEVDDEHLTLRYAREFEYRIPRKAITTVKQGLHSRALNKTRSVVDDTLVLEISNSTNIEIQLDEPRTIDLGRRGTHDVTKIEFWTDDPDGMMKALRK